MRLIDRVIAFVGGAALIISTFLILINVANRYVVQGGLLKLADAGIMPGLYEFTSTHFSSISAMADEVPGLLLVWVAFLGAYLAMRDGGHINFDLVVEKMSEKTKNILLKLDDLLIMGFLVLLLVQSWRMIMVDGSTEIETAEISQGWFMSILVIFSVLMLIALVNKFISGKKP